VTQTQTWTKQIKNKHNPDNYSGQPFFLCPLLMFTHVYLKFIHPFFFLGFSPWLVHVNFCLDVHLCTISVSLITGRQIWYTVKKKNVGCFNPIFGSNMDKPSHLVTFLNDIFNPLFEFVHIWPKIGLKQPSIF